MAEGSAVLTNNAHVALESLAEIPYLRTTSVATFRECPARWRAQMLGEGSSHNSPAARIGTAAHLCIEHFLKSQADPSSWVLQWTPYLDQEGMPAAEIEKLLAHLEHIRNYRTDLLHTEYEFTVPLIAHGPPLRGHIDAIFRISDDHILLCDWKTNRTFESENIWRRQLQPRLYTAAAHQLWPGHTVEFEIGYVLLGRSFRWKPTGEEVLDAINHFAEVWKAIEVFRSFDHFPEIVNPRCRYCPVINTCGAMQQQMQSLFRGSHDLLAGELPLVGRYERAHTLLKVLEKIVEGLQTELKAEVQTAGGTLRTSSHEYVLQTRRRRQITDFLALWNDFWAVVTPMWGEQPMLATALSSRLQKMFTANVTAFDDLMEYAPIKAVLERHIQVVESSEPTLVTRAIQEEN